MNAANTMAGTGILFLQMKNKMELELFITNPMGNVGSSTTLIIN